MISFLHILNAPLTFSQSEVVMLIGLPACGKTSWANRYRDENKNKNYTILGTDEILTQMKVMNLRRKRNFC
eukprot:TRINITY_DN2352_c0_g1_i1.p1 TRINITY_DN2352_c0_g1~~TRINITY_DN2352_c0_g1_i1.p1  ORF type:complete len:71 (+),score=6.98 TRINITY_DN2352_c0_g1_i1:275-487(+)